MTALLVIIGMDTILYILLLKCVRVIGRYCVGNNITDIDGSVNCGVRESPVCEGLVHESPVRESSVCESLVREDPLREGYVCFRIGTA